MSAYLRLKHRIYIGKLFWRSVFGYPALTISPGNHVDYDTYWEAKRGEKIGALSDWQKARADIALSRISVPARITDVGCGDGSILAYLQTKRPEIKAVGVDISETALKKAHESGIETIQADAMDLRVLERLEPADYFLLFEVLEHVPQSEQFLKIVYEKAQKGVLFSFPNSGFISYRLRLLFGKFPAQWKVHPGEHLRFWTAADVRWWLKAIDMPQHEILFYKGIPFLNRLFPSLFAAGIVVYISK